MPSPSRGICGIIFCRHRCLNLPEVTDTHSPPPLRTKLLVVERGFSRIDPLLRRSSMLELRASSTRFKQLVGVRFVTKFTPETFNRRVEKFFIRCCCCKIVRPRLLVVHHFLRAQSISKRVGAESTQDKSETGSGNLKKRRRADWPPSQPGEEFSYTFQTRKSTDSCCGSRGDSAIIRSIWYFRPSAAASAGGSSTSARFKCEVCGESWEKSKIQP